MTRFGELLGVLGGAGVEFVLIGGVAAVVHGSARSTQDVDIVYRRDRDNYRRLAGALAPFEPYLRGLPLGLPFRLTEATLAAGLNFTLTTTLGWIDLWGEIAGWSGYEALEPHSLEVRVFAITCKVIDLPALIVAKRAAGRPKDLEVLAELELLLDRRSKDEAAG